MRKRLLSLLLALIMAASLFPPAYADSDVITPEAGDTPPEGDEVIYPIAYHLNGGENAQGNPNSFSTYDPIILLPPSRQNYIFCGWFAEEDFSGDPIRILSDGTVTEVYAKWMNIVEGKSVQLGNLTNAIDGVAVSWAALEGAERYHVFRKDPEAVDWAPIAVVEGTSYRDTDVVSGVEYSYTVCGENDGNCSLLDETGKTITYVAAPIVSVSNVAGGVKISWARVAGAAKYRVYYKTGTGGWKKLVDTASNSFVDKKGKIGTRYYYTVRCLAADGVSYVSTFDTAGKSIIYYKLATPAIPKTAVVAGGVKVSWSKVSGAVKYRVFRKTGTGGWQKVADTTSLSYVDKTARNGKQYTYSIRCVSSDGKSVTSNMNTTGRMLWYMTAPALTSAANASGKRMVVKWARNGAATAYQIQYSTSAKFSTGTVTVTVEGSANVKTVIDSLAKGKTYYVRIRSCRTISGTNYYSLWTDAKSVKSVKITK